MNIQGFLLLDDYILLLQFNKGVIASSIEVD